MAESPGITVQEGATVEVARDCATAEFTVDCQAATAAEALDELAPRSSAGDRMLDLRARSSDAAPLWVSELPRQPGWAPYPAAEVRLARAVDSGGEDPVSIATARVSVTASVTVSFATSAV